MSLLSQLIIRISADSSGVLAGTRAAEGGLNSLNRSATAAGAGIDRTATKAGRSWSTMGRQIDRGAVRAAAGGRVMTRNLTFPILAAGAASVKMAVDFDTSLRKISSLVGASDKQMTMYRDGILELGKEVPQAPKELADALYFVTSSGFEGAKALEVLRASAKASAAGLGETLTVADAVTSAVNAYGEENLKAAKATDILLAAVREGKAEPEELAGVIGRVIPLGAELGISFDQIAAGVAAMSLGGLDAAESVTALRGILTQILKPAAQSEEALKKIGLSAQGLRNSVGEKGLLPTLLDLKARLDLSDDSLAKFNKTMDDKGALAAVRQFKDENEGVSDALGKLFPNVRALAGFLNLVGRNADKNAKVFDDLSDSVGDTDKAFKKASKGDRFQFQQDLNKLRIAAIELGEDLMPVAHEVVDVVTGMADAFNSLDEGTRRNLIKTAAALALFGPAIRTISPLLRGGVWSASKITSLVKALSGGAAASAGGSAIASGLGAVGGGVAAKGGSSIAAKIASGSLGSLAVGGLAKGGTVAAGAAGIGLAPFAAGAAGIGIVALGIKGAIDDSRQAREEYGDWVKRIGVDAALSSGKVMQVGDKLHVARKGFSVGTGADSTMQGNEIGQIDALRAAHDRARRAGIQHGASLLLFENGLDKSSQAYKDYLSVAERNRNMTRSQQRELARGTKAMDRWGDGLDAATRNQIAHKVATGDVKGALRLLGRTVDETKGRIKGAKDATTGFTGALDRLPPRKDVDTDPAKKNLDEATRKTHGWERALSGLPKTVTSRANLDTSQADAAFARLFGQLHGWERSAASATAAPPRGGTGGSVPARAAGGPVDALRPYLIGEKGVELFIPKTPGFVVPNHALKSSSPATGFGRGGGGGRMRARIEPGARVALDASGAFMTIAEMTLDMVDASEIADARQRNAQNH